jgi:hypothetical protein
MTKEKTNLLIINRLRSKGYDTDNMDFTIVNDFVDIIYKEQLILSGVSHQRELLELVTEIANSNQVYSNTRHKLWAKKLISSNCG